MQAAAKGMGRKPGADPTDVETAVSLLLQFIYMQHSTGQTTSEGSFPKLLTTYTLSEHSLLTM